ncbi:MAG: glycosyl hydrolase-related protein, partial [Myxococcota bacterium]
RRKAASRSAVAGASPVLPVDTPWLSLAPEELLVSAFKPAADGDGVVLRVLNPGEQACTARVDLALPFERAEPVRLDEQPADFAVEHSGHELRFEVPAHALRSLRIGSGSPPGS